MRVVLDTNVLINGLKDEYSYEKRIIDAVINGELEAAANRKTLQENRLIMRQLVDNPEYTEEIDKFYDRIIHVYQTRYLDVVRDPEDNKILASAVEADADFLITNDNDLLSLEKYENVTIVNPAEFWLQWRADVDDGWGQWTTFIANQK